MPEQPTTDALTEYVEQSCASSGVPVLVQDRATLIELARRFTDG